MPDWNEILEELKETEHDLRSKAKGSYDVVRRRYLSNLHDITGRNVIIYYSGWLQRGDLPKTAINDEDKNGFMTVFHNLDHTKGIDLLLHTPGGETGATESIVEYIRSMYGTDIRCFIPQLAMSGGTVIACACREIYMGKHSSLGPIDPQIGGVPAHGVIEEFDRAYKEIKKEQSKILVWHPILNKYTPAFIGKCEKAIEMTKTMVQSWLQSGMFENLESSEAETRSKKIVDKLSDSKEMKSHNRHLSAEYCKDLGLNIKFLEDYKELQDAVLSVHHSCMHTLSATPAFKIIENHTGKAFIQLTAQNLNQS